MVFSSLEFIYLFMPPVLAVFFLLRHLNWEKGIIWWLIISSLGFYGWWSPLHLILLLSSVGINFGLHKIILKKQSKVALIIGTIGNLATLGYFKYADFLIGNFNLITETQTPLLHVVLPLAISFFTFQQISFLYDTYAGNVVKCDFARYCLFVVFFPQLIAGPIVLQKHTIPQFKLSIFRHQSLLNFSVGTTLFVIGLFKKIVLADGVAPMANSVFNLADAGQAVPMEAAWMGAIAYTFQIYFDFSGYCDMALGIARMFGIRLPLNFNSPYKSLSIIDFWRRWHITLSTFLRDYLYFPMGGNRKGVPRRYINLTATMILGGLWHGASWNFVIWGALHGTYLIINHAWRGLDLPALGETYLSPFVYSMGARMFTLTAVIIAWVFFRAESISGATKILGGMFGVSEYHSAKIWVDILQDGGFFWAQAFFLAVIVFVYPNSVEIVRKYRPALEIRALIKGRAWQSMSWWRSLAWRPSPGWSAALFIIGLASIIQIYRLDELTEFIYFNF
ncbi:MAG: MBOAT family O-acyltransferase [Sneathiella sp.]|uniref:MBOAT family O-acyltransferase n=1 Tax=Sneathiella sp. TaxID=1964365 RepID=UPI0030034B0A